MAAAVAGAALGAKLLYWLEDPQLTWLNLDNPGYLIGGKTIVGALAGGLMAVELVKRYIGLHRSTGDLYAIPLAVGISIGRLGCFLTGVSDNTYGTPTSLPWAVNFGDNIPRHPTQLYEIVFLLALVPILYRILKRIVARRTVTLSGGVASRWEPIPQSNHPYLTLPAEDVRSSSEKHATREGHNFSRAIKLTEKEAASAVEAKRFLPGDAFRFFMVTYASFRILCDFIKPYPRLLLGLGGIQWACVVILLYYSTDVARWLFLRRRRS